VKATVIILVVLAMLASGGWLLGSKMQTGDRPGSETEVVTEPVAVRRVVESVQAPGRIEPFTVVKIAAEVSARVEELPFREGQHVRRGDLVCKLDDRELMATLELTRARRDGERFRLQSDQRRLEGLATTLEFARRDLERRRALHASGDIPDRELDTALERVRDLETTQESTAFAISVAESAIAAAEAEIRRAESALENTVIRAPIDGRIDRLNVEVGEVVTGSTQNPGTEIMSISDFSRMLMIARVAESDVARVEVGQAAEIRINAFADEIFPGRVREIAVRGDTEASGATYFRTEIEIDLAGGARSIDRAGLMANVDIEIAAHEGLAIPYQAVLNRDVERLPDAVRDSPLVDPLRRRATVVYAVVDGRTRALAVEAGPSDLTHRLIRRGVKEGDRIVIGPYKALESLAHETAVRERLSAAARRTNDDAEDDASGGRRGEAQDSAAP